MCTKPGRWEVESKSLLEEQAHFGWSIEREPGKRVGRKYGRPRILAILFIRQQKDKASEQSNYIKAIFYGKQSDNRIGWFGERLEASKSVGKLLC